MKLSHDNQSSTSTCEAHKLLYAACPQHAWLCDLFSEPTPREAMQRIHNTVANGAWVDRVKIRGSEGR